MLHKVVKQLLKEFWIPGVIAGSWTAYVLWGGNISVESVLASFGPSFFLASWLTGQVFRVRKQASVESSLQTLEGRIIGLVDKLEAETRNLINHITGGDSFCFVVVMADNTSWYLIHNGEHHLQQLNVRICDIDSSFDVLNWQEAANTNVFIGDLLKGGIVKCLAQPLTGVHRRFNIFYTASNGEFIQELRLKRVEHDRWVHATRVFRQNSGGSTELLYEKADPEFPLEANGTVGY